MASCKMFGIRLRRLIESPARATRVVCAASTVARIIYIKAHRAARCFPDLSASNYRCHLSGLAPSVLSFGSPKELDQHWGVFNEQSIDCHNGCVGAAECGPAAARPAAINAEDDFQLVKVAEGVYAGIAKPGGLASGNAGFIVGDGGVLIVDTFFTPVAVEELISEIGKLTGQPIKYAVNTHYHLDHTGGNQVLAARNVPIIAHDNVMGWQTTKNRRFLPMPDELQKRRADAAKQLSETPEDQKDKRAQLERQLRRLEVMLSIKLTNPSVTFSTVTKTRTLRLRRRRAVLWPRSLQLCKHRVQRCCDRYSVEL